jgi:hypothetical protein
VIKRNAEGLSALDDAIRHTKRNYFIAGYGPFRRPPDSEQKGRFSSYRMTPLITLFSASQDLISLEQWAMDLDYRSRGKRGLKIIEEALNQLLLGMTFSRIDKKDRAIILSTEMAKSLSKLRETARDIELKPGKRTTGELKRLDQIKEQLKGTVVLDPREVPAYRVLLEKNSARHASMPSKVIPKTETCA